MDNRIKVSSLVVLADGRNLRSGASTYPYAIVTSINPFVVVSPLADMKWENTVAIEDFKHIGTADEDQMQTCNTRVPLTEEILNGLALL